MRNQNELFYSMNENFGVELNDNMPQIKGVNGYVQVPDGNLRFYVAGRAPNEEKGCYLNEQEDGSVILGYYDDKQNIRSKSILKSSGDEYINEVNILVKEWFLNGFY